MALIELPEIGDAPWGAQLNAAIQTLANIIENGRLSPGAIEATPRLEPNKPSTPSGLRIVSRVSYYGQDRMVRQRVTLDWSAVGNVPVSQYELRYVRGTETGSRSLYLTGTAAVIDLDDQAYAVAVRAQSNEQSWGPFGPTLAVPPPLPPDPLAAPTKPTGFSAYSSAFIRWDGQMVNGAPGPALKAVYVEMLRSGSWVRVGQPLYEAGEALVTGLAPATYQFRFRAEAWNQTLSPASESISITTTSLVEATITDAIEEAIAAANLSVAQSAQALNDAAAAQTIAEGAETRALDAETQAALAAGIVAEKADVLIQDFAPDVKYQIGSTLWIDTTNAENTPKRWDGNQWIVVTDKAAQRAADLAAAAHAAALAAAVRAEAAEAAAIEAANTASRAESAANGKVTIHALAPKTSDGTGKPTGAVWWQRDANGELVKQWEWTGTLWKPYSFAEGAIADGAITRLKIKDAAINDAKIADLSAGKISAGTLDAERIGARSITTPKLLISDIENYAFDLQSAGERAAYPPTPGFRYASSSTVSPGGAGAPYLIVLDNNVVGYRWMPIGEDFRVEPGEKIFMSIQARRRSASAAVSINLAIYDANMEIINQDVRANTIPSGATNNAWITYEGQATMPAGAVYARPMLKRNSSTTETAGDWLFYQPIIRRTAAGKLIVDGAITARTIAAEAIESEHIKANTIAVDRLEPNFGENLNLESNGSIILVAGAQETLQTNVGIADSKADDARALAEEAGSAAADADGKAAAADKKAGAAAAAAKAAADSLAKTQTYYRFGPTGAIIGKPNSPTELHLKNTGAEIQENGVVVTSWTSGQMTVPSLVTYKVVLGNHQLERSGNRTVVRWIGS